MPSQFSFDDALKSVLACEGGFVDDPRDPGGMTNLGVTKTVWENWIGREATEKDMRALTPAAVAPLYRDRYWDPLCCDDFPSALALCVFDFGVNAGVIHAAKTLQAEVDALADGLIGPKTIDAVNRFFSRHGIVDLVRCYSEARRIYYRSLPTYITFGRGWIKRVADVETQALRLT